MRRFTWTGALAAVMFGAGTSLAQPAVSPDAVILLKEEGKPARSCIIDKSETQPDGSIKHQVRDVQTGAVMTILDTRPAAKSASPASAPSAPAQSAAPRPSLFGRIFGGRTEAKPVPADRPVVIAASPGAGDANKIQTVAHTTTAEPPKADDPWPPSPARDPQTDPLLVAVPTGTIPPTSRWKLLNAPPEPPQTDPTRTVPWWSDKSASKPSTPPTEPSPGMMSRLARIRLSHEAESAPAAQLSLYAPPTGVVQAKHVEPIASNTKPVSASALPPAAPPIPGPALSPMTPLVGDAWNQSFLTLVLREALGPTEREQAAMLLASGPRKDSGETVAALLRSAQEDPSPNVRATCVRCLGSLNQFAVPANQTAVQKLTRDPDSRVQQEVQRAMALRGK
jgi:hypothetical protein